MKKNKMFIILMTCLPWFSIPLLGLKTFKRFLPSSLTLVLYLIAEGRLAEKKKWWWFPFNIKPNVLGELPLIIGPFFVGSLWVLKFTYGKFNLYLLTNIIIDSLFTFLGMDWLKKIGYVTLVRLPKIQLSLIFLIKTFILYGSQFLYEKVFSSNAFK
ncbi:hypothetical protein [Metabacillus rhizolycopersici]|uniref:Uncharacterized protein n=1 Tax=Metabacillus rhizolycopersici TaxID=2875709 RepID=A0ABS7UVM8_9BACI|nr:hypothetical protein [Metabacillus rhizolycopersici]MBZ5752072.1 hypothetical protein [Metabacillus rhizolycopersici]